jgi:hypothetical protein
MPVAIKFGTKNGENRTKRENLTQKIKKKHIKLLR